MRTRLNFLLAAICAIVLSSCATSTYFQVYRAVPTHPLSVSEDSMVYEDENCKVFYDFWSEYGDVGFRFYNKTDDNIYVNLGESFFVLNGMAYNYFQDRVFTDSKSSGSTTSRSTSLLGSEEGNGMQINRTSVGFISALGHSVSFHEEKIVCVPSNTSKVFKEYHISETIYRDCELFRFPTKKQIHTKLFSKADSPLVFSNRITYAVGQAGKDVKFENEFYVAEITNYPGLELLESRYEEFCGQKSLSPTKFFKNVSPDKFYLKYVMRGGYWKH